MNEERKAALDTVMELVHQGKVTADGMLNYLLGIEDFLNGEMRKKVDAAITTKKEKPYQGTRDHRDTVTPWNPDDGPSPGGTEPKKDVIIV